MAEPSALYGGAREHGLSQGAELTTKSASDEEQWHDAWPVEERAARLLELGFPTLARLLLEEHAQAQSE